MLRFLIISLLIFNMNVHAQKYTKKYIIDANNIAEKWLNNISEKKYDNAYKYFSKEVKSINSEEYWVDFIHKLMSEFGNIKERSVIEKYFKNVYQEKNGFYVFIKYETNYQKTKGNTETIVLKQNDNLDWEIIDFAYSFVDEDYKGKPKSTQKQ